jgi:hypothetical protein
MAAVACRINVDIKRFVIVYSIVLVRAAANSRAEH